MKSIGIVRNIDDLGRISVPKEIRKVLAINVGDPLEFLTDSSKGEKLIILRECKQGCIFCGSLKNTVIYKEKKVCKACIQQL